MPRVRWAHDDRDEERLALTDLRPGLNPQRFVEHEVSENSEMTIPRFENLMKSKMEQTGTDLGKGVRFCRGRETNRDVCGCATIPELSAWVRVFFLFGDDWQSYIGWPGCSGIGLIQNGMYVQACRRHFSQLHP